MKINDNFEKLDKLIETLESLEKSGFKGLMSDIGEALSPDKPDEHPSLVWNPRKPKVSTKKPKDESEGHGHLRDGEPHDAANKIEILSKPPVSEAQRKAMHAAAAGKSTLDIPKKVGKEFADADKGGKLPDKAKKTIDVFAIEGLEKISKGIPIVHYKDGKVTKVQHATGPLNAFIELQTQNMKHVKSDGDTHMFEHHLDKNHTATVFAGKKQQQKDKQYRRDTDVKKTDTEIEILEKSNSLYHIHVDGQRITKEPMSIKEINNMHGKSGISGVKRLESSGHILVPHVEPEKTEKTDGNQVVKPLHPPTTPSPTLNYSEFNKPSNQKKPSTSGKMKSPTPGAAMTGIQNQKRQLKLNPPKAPTGAEVIKERQNMKKSEIFNAITSETLTKSIKNSHSDQDITEMLKAAYDLGKIHHNVILEWQNYGTLNVALVDLIEE